MSARYGSICSGYGGLDVAVEDVFGASCAWHAEIDPHASKVLAHHWPDTPNLGDITAVDWSAVEPVDVICGGTPCQDLSSAGSRKGMSPGTRSGLWSSMAAAIEALHPRLVVWENVIGALSACAHSDLEPCPRCVGGDGPHVPVLRALGRVVGDLASLGYVGRWASVRASDVGACHRRDRVFVVAWPAAEPDGGRLKGGTQLHREPVEGAADRGARGRHVDRRCEPADLTLLPTPAASNPNDGEDPATWLARAERLKAKHGNGNGAGTPLSIAVALLPTPKATDTTGAHAVATNGRTVHDHGADLKDIGNLLPTPTVGDGQGGGKEPASWEQTTMSTGDGGASRLRDVTKLLGRMSLPSTAGASPSSPEDSSSTADPSRWGRYAAAIARHEAVTGRPAPDPTDDKNRLSPALVEWMMMLPAGWVTAHLGRTAALRCLGNGVVPAQAAAAMRMLLARTEQVAS